MEGIAPESIIKVQSLVCEAIETLFNGNYHNALNMFQEAKNTCEVLIRSEMYSGQNLDLLYKLRAKCEGHTRQINEYLESPDDIQLSRLDYSRSKNLSLNDSSVYRESNLGDTMALFPSLKSASQTERANEDQPQDNYWRGYLWDKVEALLGIIRNQSQYQHYFQNGGDPNDKNAPPREEISLDSSFYLIGSTVKEMEAQIRELMAKIAELEKENLKKDKEIKDLSVYKEKWDNLKKEASERKKQRESTAGIGTTSIADSTSLTDSVRL